MTFFVGVWLSKSVVIRACSNFSYISVKWNNTDTNKLMTINYQQLLLIFKKSNDLHNFNDLIGYEMQYFFVSWNSPSVIQEKVLIAKSIRTWN